jgi:hypothetical protein
LNANAMPLDDAVQALADMLAAREPADFEIDTADITAQARRELLR